MAFWKMHKNEKRLVGVGFGRVLDTGVTLTGTPTVTVYEKLDGSGANKTTAWTIGGKGLNSAVITDELGFTHQVNEAVVFLLGPSTAAAGPYSVLVSCATTDSQTLVKAVELSLEDQNV